MTGIYGPAFGRSARSLVLDTALRQHDNPAHKTGAIVLHPLQDGDSTLFYRDAGDVLGKVPRRGIPMILHETRERSEKDKPKATKLYSPSGMAKLVRRLRVLAKLPPTFTLDACRHGGMTELEEAELTDGQDQALSAHKSRAYESYAKRTMERALAATRKRHAHRLAGAQNDSGPEFRNGQQSEFRNDEDTATNVTRWRQRINLLDGWGARIRTWEWRNQNPLLLLRYQMLTTLKSYRG
jgi:hypothetical protein